MEHRVLTGYLSALSVRQGEGIDCMVSAAADEVTLDVVRLQHGDENPAGPGPKVIEVSEIEARRVGGGTQATFPGSCVVVPSVGVHPVEGIELEVIVQPTSPRAGRFQGIVALRDAAGRPGLVVGIDADGALVLQAGEDAHACAVAVAWQARAWYRVSVVVRRGGGATLECVRLDGRAEVVQGRAETTVPASDSLVEEVVIAARGCRRLGAQWQPVDGFDGKVENPVLRRSTADGHRRLLGDWRFELSPSGRRCDDVSGNEHHGTVVNAPLRAATGHTWSGREVDFTKVPEQYGAIHFHVDDLDDAGWTPSATIDVPPDLPSGVYAVRLTTDAEEDHLPFVVTPAQGGERARVAVLLPTFTYVAYANERMVTRLDFEGDQMSDHAIRPKQRDVELARHPEWGLSLYDLHADGSACAYSSSLRPIPNLRADYRSWLQDAPRHLSADLYLIDWLTECGHEFDVVTDHDLHRDGPALLDGHDVVITGSHPEYVSEQILDSLESHLDAGGSLMYLGGNGFYWVTSQDAERPHLIEVRRGPVGTRPSEGEPGEGHHSTTGEPGGLWRQRGRWPNRLTGIGMTSQGWDSKAPGYRRTDAGRAPRFAFVFDGVEEEVIGDFGLIMDGASGDELDRFDPERGSPPETVVLASTTGHSDYYQLVGEDVLATRPGLGGRECADVRSDMTWLERTGGGAVFSVGSICYTGSLSHHGYRNNVSQVTGNALREMLRRGPKAPAR